VPLARIKELLGTAAPEQAAPWIAEKLAALADPGSRTLCLDYDAAFEWAPDDPRLPALAERTRRRFAGQPERAEGGRRPTRRSSGWPRWRAARPRPPGTGWPS